MPFPRRLHACVAAVGLTLAVSACGDAEADGEVASPNEPPPRELGSDRASTRTSATFVGLTIDDGGARADAENRPWRIVRQDGQDLITTEDYSPDRLNFTIDDGIITGADTDAERTDPAAGCDRMIHTGALPTWAESANV